MPTASSKEKRVFAFLPQMKLPSGPANNLSRLLFGRRHVARSV
jgi:hypothetical protein